MHVSSQVMRHFESAVLFRLAESIALLARSLRAMAHRLDAWLERRRPAIAAAHELDAMSERELRDIGLTRGDIESVVRRGSPLSHL
jgi:uncharacterized protein YjiS (DUF1127 family)